MPKTATQNKTEKKSAQKAVEAKKETKTASKKPAKPQNGALFAVISTGGKQYKVAQGDKLKVEKIKGDYKEGDKVVFDKVLLVDDGENTSIGDPHIKGAQVSATILKIGRASKVTVIKYKAKSRYFNKRGHRQPYFEVRIDSIK